MAKIVVRYWAAARDAAGVTEEIVAADTLAEALAVVTGRRGDRLSQVLARSSFLIDDAPVGRRDLATLSLHDDAVVEVLPPFAGG